MTARILCLILLLCEIRGLALVVTRSNWKKLFAFYTELSNMAGAVSAAGVLIFGPWQMPWITALRYLSTCMLVMTFLVTAFVLVPMGADPKQVLWSGNGLYHHVICPILCAVSYLFFEGHAGKGMLWLPVSVTLVYGLIMLYLNGAGKVDGPYPFFRVKKQAPAATVLWIFVLVLLVTGISAAVAAVPAVSRVAVLGDRGLFFVFFL